MQSIYLFGGVLAAVFTLGLLISYLASPRESEQAPSEPAATGADTEFMAEIVRITEILPHGNADKLEIAKFETRLGPASYEVVVQKEQYKPGDLAAYFSVDCIVPTAHPDFEFLSKRLDGAGKEHYRIKAARLRGVFSQGLLVPTQPGAEFGKHVATAYGVTYYRPPEEQETRGPTPSSGKKPEAQPMPVYGVDSLKKLPRLFEEGEPVVLTEKVHGSNLRVGWFPKKFLGFTIGWRFVVGSHRVIKGEDSTSNHYYGEDVWLATAAKFDLAKRLLPYKGHAVYGEVYGYTFTGKKIQDLTYGRKPGDGPGLVIFDVRRPDGRWLSYQERREFCIAIGLPMVPVVHVGPWHPSLRELAEGNSLIAPNQIREGVVVESPEGPRKKAKYVGQGYLLRDEGGKAPNPKKDAPRAKGRASNAEVAS